MHLGQDGSLSLDTIAHTLIYTVHYRQFRDINQPTVQRMSLDLGRKLEYPAETHKLRGKTCKHHTYGRGGLRRPC